ncbi:delta-sterol C-methyltransferase [Favolaschia claudopus]|uniref:Delta-sterol C-methyltransferase n=1 Tax=Favolaschia claudopus TaxID=2862362 RepID=A0AAW0E7M7_9AGAR
MAQNGYNDMADGRKRDRLVNYSTHWNKDLSKEDESNTQARVGGYTEVVNGFYDAVTQLYEYSWGESFHFCRFYKGEAFAAAQARHEQYLASMIGLRPGMRVLDVGCGVGGPARTIARFADAQVTGVTINEFQVQRARKYTKAAELDDLVTFEQGDFTKLTEKFPENYFDAVYAIEATVHAPTWESVYGEIFKVLKPGGKFGVYEWCMTDRWDASNPEHVRLQHEIEYGNGIPEMRPMKTIRPALESVGFEVVHEEDLAERKDKIRTLGDYVRVWRLSRLGIFLTHMGVQVMEWTGIMPAGMRQAARVLHVAATSLIATGKTKLFTPMYLVVSQKPGSS